MNSVQNKPRKLSKNPSSKIFSFANIYIYHEKIFNQIFTHAGSFSADSLIQPLFIMPFSCMQQNVISPQRVFSRRSISGIMMTWNGISLLMLSYNRYFRAFCAVVVCFLFG